MQSSQEELKSTNEELQSTNEELTTSREELQSLNEELQTVNAEQQAKMDELGRINSLCDPLICISSFTEKNRTVVTITDKAGGIDSEIINRLFESLSAPKRTDKGAGIGFYLSRTIIETTMGGSLTVFNTGEGAQFRIEVNNA
jgi:signal transduction histidine kinase